MIMSTIIFDERRSTCFKQAMITLQGMAEEKVKHLSNVYLRKKVDNDDDDSLDSSYALKFDFEIFLPFIKVEVPNDYWASLASFSYGLTYF